MSSAKISHRKFPVWQSPWRDRAGRFSVLKTIVFVGVFLPAVGTLVQLLGGAFMAEPAKQVVHELGLWAFRLILLSLVVTPAMQIFRWPRLILVRRMIGVAAFAYAFAHLIGYGAMENFDLAKVGSEIVTRLYLIIGLSALLILGSLAVTSTDAMIRRMGQRRWALFHRAVYVVALLGSIHYFMQTKLVVTEPTIFAGLLVWLMGYRVLFWRVGMRAAARVPVLVGLAVIAAGLTMGGEAIGYTLLTPVDGMKVFDANFTFIAGIRPGWWVLIVGMGVAAAALLRGLIAPLPKRVVAAT
jgi:sulfoxide reductase heme-binding subunit YedZ